MLPSTKPEDADALRSMVHRILSRPRNVMRLQPKNFEHLIKHLLEAMEFEQVRVSSNQRDGGIDVEASVCEKQGGLQHQRRVLVQCKRYSYAVSREAVAEFVEQTLKPAKSAQGLFITTSTFAEGVHEVCSGQRLDLIDGAKLQEYLDRHFGAGVYCIRI
jgi:restriction endonuclease Mrr